MAAHGRGLANSGESMTFRPIVLPHKHQQHKTDSEQWREEKVRGLSGTATCELGSAAKMAIRWSHHLGELYLGQK
jgi:hypothetical protein